MREIIHLKRSERDIIKASVLQCIHLLAAA